MISSESFLALGGHGEVSIDVASDKARLLVYLAPAMGRRFREKGFWLELHAAIAGEASLGWCHFALAFEVNNRFAYALDDVRHPADAPTDDPQWLLPPKTRTRASSSTGAVSVPAGEAAAPGS